MKMASVRSAQGVCERKMKGMLLCVELVDRCKAMQDPLTKSDTLTSAFRYSSFDFMHLGH